MLKLLWKVDFENHCTKIKTILTFLIHLFKNGLLGMIISIVIVVLSVQLKASFMEIMSKALVLSNHGKDFCKLFSFFIRIQWAFAIPAFMLASLIENEGNAFLPFPCLVPYSLFLEWWTSLKMDVYLFTKFDMYLKSLF